MKKSLPLLIGSSLLTLGAVAMTAPQASALTLTGNSCTDGLLSGTTTCAGGFEGNNSNQNLDDLFGKAWESGSYKSGEIKVDSHSGTMGALTVTSNSDKKSGTWSLEADFIDKYAHAMFVVKAGSNFATYLWDGSTTSGNWFTDDLRTGKNGSGKNVPGLSHFSVYGFGERIAETPVESVPEPAAMTGLVMVGAGIVISRRKKVQQA